MTTIPSKSVTLVLTTMILSVYILQQNSDMIDNILVHKVGDIDNFPTPPNTRHILNNARSNMSRQDFWKKTQELRRKIDSIAAQHGAAIRKPYPGTSDTIKQSRTIVYNRIDKAGSTTLISKIFSYHTVRTKFSIYLK